MKKIITTVGFILMSLLSFSQIGVITIKKNQSVPLNMWYTIDEKDRENNLYITYEDEEYSLSSLTKLLLEFDMEIDNPSDEDIYGDPYWTVVQENGYVSDIYYIKEKDFPLYTITIVSAWSGE